MQLTRAGATGRRVSVVIPVFNAEDTLDELLARLAVLLEAHCDAFEVILVNDGSRDSSWARIVDLAASRPWMRGVDLMRNYGQHNALLCGIQAAREPLIVTLDDDLQNPPEEIPKLLDRLALKPDVDVVYGVPVRAAQGAFRSFATGVVKFSLRSAMGNLAQEASTFRAFRTEVRAAFESYTGPDVSIDVLLSWGSSRFDSVTVRHDPRLNGRSNYNFVRLGTHALNMLTGFSVWPLRIASLVGFASALIGLVALVYVIGRYILSGGHSVAGFTFLAAAIAIFSGAQLFSLGVFGEYMARLHFRSMGRPPSVVRRTTLPTDAGAVLG